MRVLPPKHALHGASTHPLQSSHCCTALINSRVQEELAAARQQGNNSACADLETQIRDLSALVAKHSSRGTTAAGTPAEPSPAAGDMAESVHLAVQADGWVCRFAHPLHGRGLSANLQVFIF